MKTRGRPQKTKDSLKDRVQQIRITQLEKESFEEAARALGITCASWARMRLREACRKDLEAVNKKPKFY
jgi:hypothetical protein